MQELRLMQINLHKSKTASAELLLRLEDDISTDDLTVVAIVGGSYENTLLAPCYMPHDAEAPPQEHQKLVRLAGERRQPFVVVKDANAHHTLWGSSDCNDRGESLLYFLLTNGLYMTNRGDVSTYVDPSSENVLDLRLYNDFCFVVEDWRVLEDPSLSNHKYISFRMDCEINRVSGRSRKPRNTDWVRYTTVLSEMLGKPRRINSHPDLESKVNTLSKVFNKAYCLSCAIVRRKRKSKLPWWNG